MRIFLDTCVLLDFYARREDYFDDTTRLIVASTFGDVNLWTSAKSYTDIFYFLNKRISSKEIQIIFKNSFKFFKVCSIDLHDIEAAIKLSWEDFEDCLVYLAAKGVGADYIVTRNKKDFSRSDIPVVTQGEFISLMEKEKGLSYETIL